MHAIEIDPVVQKWFDCWNSGQVDDLPIADDFKHTSPFGTIESKQTYLDIVSKNKDDFLGNELTVLKHIKQGRQVCVQFHQNNELTGLSMEVCEWYELEGELIKSIRSFYNVGNAEIKG